MRRRALLMLGALAILIAGARWRSHAETRAALYAPWAVRTPVPRVWAAAASTDFPSRDEPSAAIATGGVVVAGTVRDLFGAGVPGAIVANSSAITRTDAAGAFTLHVAAGHVSLHVQVDGFAPAVRDGLAPASHFDFALIPEAELRGQVIARGTHAPVAGVTVVGRGTPIAGLGLPHTGRASSITDAEGRFALTGLAPGHYTLAVESNGWFGRAPAVDAASASPVDGISIEVSPGAQVRGRVVGGDGAPCPAASVALRSHANAIFAIGDPIAFAAVPPGDYQVRVTCDGPRVTEQSVVHVGDHALADLVWRADPGLPIAGRVIDANGNAVADAELAITSADDRIAGEHHSGADGRFAIGGLDPGSYTLAIVTTDQRARSADVTAAAGTTDVTLVTSALATVRGHIDATQPGWTAVATDEAGMVATAAVDASGNFELADLAPGPQRIAVCDPWAGEIGTATAMAPGADVRVTARAFDTVLAGQVVDDRGAPVDDALVTAASTADSPCAAGATDRGPVATDEHGRFRLPALPGGDYALEAHSLGGARGTAKASATTVIEVRAQE